MPRTTRRQHRDTLIAGLILVGAAFCVRSVGFLVIQRGMVTGSAMTFIGAFVAAQLARMILVELATSDVVMAAVVAMLVILGIQIERDEEELALILLLPTATAMLGALLGAITSRRRRAATGRVWLVVGAGFAGYGALVLVASFSRLLDSDALGAVISLLGPCAACLLVALATPAGGFDCGLGVGIVLLAALGAIDPSSGGAAVIGGLLGALGGAIGAGIRRRRVPKTELPNARLRADQAEVSRRG